jgi:hypothetical protein
MASKPGGLANRLVAFSHFIANAIEYDYKLINPTFDEYCQYFPSLAQNRFRSYPIHSKFVVDVPFSTFKKILNLTRRLRNSPLHAMISAGDDIFDLSDPVFLALVRKKVVFTNGWLFRDYKSIEKHAAVIRSFFKPLPQHAERAAQAVATIKDLADVVVGVHIRRGDYREWRGGSYFYEYDVYREKILQLKSYFRSKGKKIAFLVCSDEKVEQSALQPASVYPGPGHLVEDLYALAGCDYLIGPPSTFSKWASFYGQVPLMHICNPHEAMALEKFQVFASLEPGVFEAKMMKNPSELEPGGRYE